MKQAMLAMLVLLMAPATAHAVYKCEMDGRTVYQQTPCVEGRSAAPGDGTFSQMGGGIDHASQRWLQERIHREKREAARANAAAAARERERDEQRRVERQARRSGIVAEGMSERDARRMYGTPDSVNISQSGGRSCKHLRWRDPYRTVMVCDGEVANSYAQGVE
ncbi:DUF4124 domain-containing protein [Halomonas koreensis]|uniref:DUF4124 domain-containing protein n=1 Tax=Halomonas koreensis TaxID=245385 RepID=A0ABU1G325_9GAMM|nr:DUF4124 domain-containing protein [Halomonas koreensis]MDR5867305.1 DUF4124 domain-containing protein [Halomonas koreensis]